MIVASLAFETRTFTLNGELIFAMAWLVLVLSIGAIFLLMIMIRDGEISKVASLFYLVPAQRRSSPGSCSARTCR